MRILHTLVDLSALFGILRIFCATILSAVFLLGNSSPAHTQDTATNGVRGKPIALAGIWASTGRSAATMKTLIDGATCGVRFVNEHGGVSGRPLKLTIYDSRSSPEGAEDAVRQAIRDNSAVLLGAGWSSYTLPAARIAQAHGVPFISSMATNPNITLVGDYIFRICFSDVQQGRVLAAFARRELGAKRAALLRDSESEYSSHLARSFARTFEELGGRVVLEKTYRYSSSRYGMLVKMVEQAEPDLLFVPGHDESAVILSRAQAMGLKTIFLGGDGWDVPSFWEKGGSSLSSGYYTTHWEPELDSPFHMTFLEYCDMTESSSALTFDAVLLAADAMERADPEDHDAIRNALEATRGFQGVTGIMDMTAWGDAIKPVVLKKIVNGEDRLVRRYMP